MVARNDVRGNLVSPYEREMYELLVDSYFRRNPEKRKQKFTIQNIGGYASRIAQYMGLDEYHSMTIGTTAQMVFASSESAGAPEVVGNLESAVNSAMNAMSRFSSNHFSGFSEELLRASNDIYLLGIETGKRPNAVLTAIVSSAYVIYSGIADGKSMSESLAIAYERCEDGKVKTALKAYLDTSKPLKAYTN